MSTLSPTIAANVLSRLGERCAQLGVALYPITKTATDQPIAVAWQKPWATTRAIQSLATTAALQPPTKGTPVPFEVAEGCWALSLRQPAAVVLIFTKPWLTSAAFVAAANELAIDPSVAASTWKPVLRDDPTDVSTAMRWSLDDVAKAESDEQTIMQFSDRLSQSYEETALLFTLARLMNAADPIGSLQAIIGRVQEIMPFGWIALRFDHKDKVIAPLRDRTTVAGAVPIAAEQLDGYATELIACNGKHRILEPRRDSIATATGAQVLAQPIVHDDTLIGLLLGGNKGGSDPELSSFETQFMEATAGFLGIFHENLSRFAEQKESFFGTLRALTAAIDAKDHYTRGHSDRVGLLAAMIAEAMGMDTAEVDVYRTAGLVHDVGKIGVPEAVLGKMGRLTDEEFEQIKRHPTIGFNIMRDIPTLEKMRPGVLHHHERWDGRGYPAKLAGEATPLIARVLAVCDTFDALSSTRSYRPAWPRDAVIAEIRKSAGTQLDPTIVEVFLKLDLAAYDAMLTGHTEAWSTTNNVAAA